MRRRIGKDALRRFWRRLMRWSLRLEHHLQLGKLIFTLTSFALFILVLPVLACVYAGMKLWRWLWWWWGRWRIGDCGRVVDASSRWALHEAAVSACTVTLVLELEGEVNLQSIQQRFMDELVLLEDATGSLAFPNLRKRFEKCLGFRIWRDDEDFSITNHVTAAPAHYRGRTLTTRNIQEYLSVLSSTPLPTNRPPWSVTLAVAAAPAVSMLPLHGTCYRSEGRKVTFVFIRSHPLLAEGVTLHALLASSCPDPWRADHARQSILSAPVACRRLCQGIYQDLSEWSSQALSWLYEKSSLIKKLKNPTTASYFALWYILIYRTILECLEFLQRKELMNRNKLIVAYLLCVHIFSTLPIICVEESRLFGFSVEYYRATGVSAVKVVQNLTTEKVLLWLLMSLKSMLITITHVLFKFLIVCAGILIRLPSDLHWFIKAVYCKSDDRIELMRAALIEVYWMSRAAISLPRILLEELILTCQGEAPLAALRRRSGTNTRSEANLPQTLAWSDAVPISTATGVKGATGATMSEVLFAATTRALRDYLRACGVRPPDSLACSLPVHSHIWATARRSRGMGLVTLSLPTGATGSREALREVRRRLDSVRRYPVRYLAMLWLLNNIVFFLPDSILMKLFNSLTSRYPLLLSNLSGPEFPVNIWGHELNKIFYWRPPQASAVISLSIVSYGGHAYLGVMADQKAAPMLAAILPQAFVTHLNELAIDSGVKLERSFARSWSRHSTPPTTPLLSPAAPLQFSMY